MKDFFVSVLKSVSALGDEPAAFCIATSALILCVMLIMIASKLRYAMRFTSVALIIAALGGIIIYGIAFCNVCENMLLAVIRTLFAVCSMFVGGNSYIYIENTEIMQNTVVQVLFWVLHLMALYVTASAVFVAVGETVVKKLKQKLARYKDINIIYGVNAGSVAFGKQLVKKGNKNLIFIDDMPAVDYVNAINEMGCIVRSDNGALNISNEFLTMIGTKRRKNKITLYAIDEKNDKNMVYVEKFVKALKAENVDSKKTKLIMIGNEDKTDNMFFATKERYGFGSVNVFSETSLAARVLMQKMPPYKKMTFNGEGTATTDFDALIIGFGKTAQEVLKRLVMNGQFNGSHFHAAVFSHDAKKEGGYFINTCRSMFNEYDIEFINGDARSDKLFTYIESRKDTLKYVAICTGNEWSNREIAQDIERCLMRMGNNAAICRCTTQAVRYIEKPGQNAEYFRLFSTDIIANSKADTLAMLINQQYYKDNGKNAKQNWENCDYFSRLSCIASAEYVYAILNSTGKQAHEVAKNGWQLKDEVITELGKAEHLRWEAFHLAMGFTPMSRETYLKRAQQYKEQKESGKPTMRIGKDLEKREHSCLIPWEELDELSKLETQFTGKNIDYKQMDINNVLAIPVLLKELENQ